MEPPPSYHTLGKSPTVPVNESTMHHFLMGPRSIHQYGTIFDIKQSGGNKKKGGKKRKQKGSGILCCGLDAPPIDVSKLSSLKKQNNSLGSRIPYKN
jgi:hypothetical protein